MLSSLRAYKEMMSFASGNPPRHFRKFFGGNIIRVFTNEGLFDFLEETRSFNELVEHFGYTDLQLFKEVLDVLVDDKKLELEQLEGGEVKYNLPQPIEDKWARPPYFDAAITEIWQGFAQGLPQRLKGQTKEFSSGINLYNWDDALSNQFYAGIRRCAFVYANAYNRPGRFLDVSCGNGFGTADIWSYYHKRGYFSPNPKKKIEIVGLDIDENLLKIAREEFPRMAAITTGEPIEKINELEEHFPKFEKGDFKTMPFEDNIFDTVYVSQSLHWGDPRKGIAEMLRVAKPGGMIFGNQGLLPRIEYKYWSLHIKVVEGAYGFFNQKDFIEWIKEAGGQKIKLGTPIVIFKYHKREK